MKTRKTQAPKHRIPVAEDVLERLRDVAERRDTFVYRLADRILRAGLGRFK